MFLTWKKTDSNGNCGSWCYATMAMVNSDPFKEHATVIDALKASYSGPEDVSMVEEVNRIEKELTEVFGERILNMQDVVRSMHCLRV